MKLYQLRTALEDAYFRSGYWFDQRPAAWPFISVLAYNNAVALDQTPYPLGYEMTDLRSYGGEFRPWIFWLGELPVNEVIEAWNVLRFRLDPELVTEGTR